MFGPGHSLAVKGTVEQVANISSLWRGLGRNVSYLEFGILLVGVLEIGIAIGWALMG
jgi:hypothetical protein